MMVFKGKEKGYSKSIHNKLEIPILEGGGLVTKWRYRPCLAEFFIDFYLGMGIHLSIQKKKVKLVFFYDFA